MAVEAACSVFGGRATEKVPHRQARGLPETAERITWQVRGAVLGAHARLGGAPAATSQARTPHCVRGWTPAGEEGEVTRQSLGKDHVQKISTLYENYTVTDSRSSLNPLHKNREANGTKTRQNRIAQIQGSKGHLKGDQTATGTQ